MSDNVTHFGFDDNHTHKLVKSIERAERGLKESGWMIWGQNQGSRGCAVFEFNVQIYVFWCLLQAGIGNF